MVQTLGLIAADYESSLATKMAVGDTTATLLSATDDDGVTLATGKYYLTIDGNNSSKEHIYCTLTGTSLTNIQNVTRQGVVTDGCLKTHRIGAKVILTDFANIKFVSDMLNGSRSLNGSAPMIYDTDPTLTDDKHVATKKYIDDVAIAGGAKSTEAVYGLTRLSVAAASAVAPIAVGDNDGRVPSQDENNALAGTAGTPSTTNKFVTADDVTEAKTASKIPRRDANSDILVATTPTAGDAATSKTYVDTAVSSDRFISSSTSATTAIPSNAHYAIIQARSTTGTSGAASFNLYIDSHINSVVETDTLSTGATLSASATWNSGGSGNLVVTVQQGTSPNDSSILVAFYK